MLSVVGCLCSSAMRRRQPITANERAARKAALSRDLIWWSILPDYRTANLSLLASLLATDPTPGTIGEVI